MHYTTTQQPLRWIRKSSGYVKLAAFATKIGAIGFVEALQEGGVSESCTIAPKWTNKKLPPPRVEVHVCILDADRAREILIAFKGGKA